MRNLSRLPSDPAERRDVLSQVVRQYEVNGIHDTVYHRLFAEAEAELAVSPGEKPDEEQE